MARPKKQINYEEELMKIDMQLTKCKNTISELQERRQLLQEEQERNALGALYQAMQASGKTVDDVLALLEAQKALE